MLSHEWHELELLCQRISDLRHRYAAAMRTSNAGLIEGLKIDLARTKRLRDLVIHHISARLGAAAADASHPAPPVDSSDPETMAAPPPSPDAVRSDRGFGFGRGFER